MNQNSSKTPDRNRQGFSVIEMITIIAIIGALAFVTIPRLNSGTSTAKKAETTACKIVTDLRRTRQLSISRGAVTGPDEKTVVLEFTAPSPYAEYKIIDNRTDPDSVIATETIDTDVSITGDQIMEFNSNGTLVGLADSVNVSGGGDTYTIDINTNGYIELTGP